MNKNFIIALFITIILLGQITNISYAKELPGDNLIEKYDLLREQNIRLRAEILKLKNKLSKKQGEKIPVLLYHHILTQEEIDEYNWGDNASVLSLETFEKHMDYLDENGFYTATVDELQSFLNGEIILPEKTVVITFDDGYLSNALYAYPILQKYNFRATIFMLGYRVDDIQVPFDPSTTQSLSIMEAYKYSDVFDYESHTYDLHNFNKNKVPLIISSENELVLKDLKKSKELLDAKYFAYPYGKYDENTINQLKQANYEMAFTVEGAYVKKGLNKYELPRFSITPKNTPFSRFMRIVNGNYEIEKILYK